MFEKELKPIDVTRFTVTENGNVIRSKTMTEELKQKAEAEADKVIIGSGMDRASVIHLKHLLVTMYMQGTTEVTKEFEKQNKELQEEITACKFAMTMSDKVEKQLREQIEKMKCLLKENGIDYKEM